MWVILLDTRCPNGPPFFFVTDTSKNGVLTFMYFHRELSIGMYSVEKVLEILNGVTCGQMTSVSSKYLYQHYSW